MYKKLFTVLFAVIMIFAFTGTGMANGSGIAFGSLDIGAKAKAGVIDWDVDTIPNGIAGGISGAYGSGKAGAKGFVLNGNIDGKVNATGGGLTVTVTEGWNPGFGSLSIGIGSESFSQGTTAANASISIGPDRRGFGIVGAHINGFTAQGTLNGSILGASPLGFWESNGFTGGIAGQGSVGWFSGNAFAVSCDGYEDDYTYEGGKTGDPGYYVKINGETAGTVKYFKNGHPEEPSEWVFLGTTRFTVSAKIGASINMYGGSYSKSYRFVEFGVDYKTEGMGTFVGANTTVISSSYADTDINGCSGACTSVDGRWFAAGGAASYTTQDAPRFGGAEATAVGYYVGSGSLGTNFAGSAVGYTGTTITMFNGLNGSINSAGAGMSVSSHVTSGHDDPR